MGEKEEGRGRSKERRKTWIFWQIYLVRIFFKESFVLIVFG